MSDPIKDALRVATMAFCETMTGGGCRCLAGLNETQCGIDGAAVAPVTAFLRALPDDVSFAKWSERERYSLRLVEGAEDFEDLAAAVEKAARDG